MYDNYTFTVQSITVYYLTVHGIGLCDWEFLINKIQINSQDSNRLLFTRLTTVPHLALWTFILTFSLRSSSTWRVRD